MEPAECRISGTPDPPDIPFVFCLAGIQRAASLTRMTSARLMPVTKTPTTRSQMKLVIIAAAAALFAASCCPNIPPPNKPAYVTPTK